MAISHGGQYRSSRVVNQFISRIFFVLVTGLALGQEQAVAWKGVFDRTLTDRAIMAFQEGRYERVRELLGTDETADDPGAWYVLGRMYQEGLGGYEVDMGRAERLYRAAAEAGHVDAMLALADLFARGSGVNVNAAVARVWYERAAKAGNVPAMLLLANDLAGRNGAAPDYARARIWYEQAAAAGSGAAMAALGGFSRNGLGVDLSFVDAVMWYRLAMRHGSQDAVGAEALLVRFLAPAELAEVDRRLGEWEQLTGWRSGSEAAAAEPVKP